MPSNLVTSGTTSKYTPAILYERVVHGGPIMRIFGPKVFLHCCSLSWIRSSAEIL